MAAIRCLVMVMVLIWAGGALAQHGRDVTPAPLPGSPSGANPTAQAPNEQQLLQEFGRLQGRLNIPDARASVLQQPQGRQYQEFHERILPWASGILILATIIGLAILYLIRGSMTVDEPPTGVTVRRFSVLERLTHWTTATSFVVLAITGLNYVFGKRLLLPLIGPDAFSAWSQWAKFAHNFFSWPFMIGVVLMIVLWLRDNVFDRYDWVWLRQLGGVFSGAHAPARRFNAGEKGVFWAVVVFGIALSATGIALLLPFWVLDINGMQMAHYIHAAIGSIFIAVIIFHIYVGTLMVRGAFTAMSTGDVDLAWMRQHHPIWVEEHGDELSGKAREPGRPAGVPAE